MVNVWKISKVTVLILVVLVILLPPVGAAAGLWMLNEAVGWMAASVGPLGTLTTGMAVGKYMKRKLDVGHSEK